MKKTTKAVSTPSVDVGKPKSFEDWPMIAYAGIDMRPDLHTMHTVITEKNLWAEFAKGPGASSFAESTKPHVMAVEEDPRIEAIGFSGVAQGFAMRCMQVIALHGWDEFKSSYSSTPSSIPKATLKPSA